MKRVNKIMRKLVFTIVVFAMGITTFNYSSLAAALSNDGVIGVINSQRRAAGLPELTANSKLSTSAFLKAQDMCTKHYWAHNAPDGTTPWSFVDAAGYNYLSVGENLAQGFADDGALVAAWMASPAHRDNILATKYQDIGIATMTCKLIDTEVSVVVAHFGSTPQAAPKQASKPVAAPAQPITQPAAEPAPTVTPVVEPEVKQATATASQPSFIELLLSQLTAYYDHNRSKLTV